jgi:hypothetical protein
VIHFLTFKIGADSLNPGAMPAAVVIIIIIIIAGVVVGETHVECGVMATSQSRSK